MHICPGPFAFCCASGQFKSAQGSQRYCHRTLVSLTRRTRSHRGLRFTSLKGWIGRVARDESVPKAKLTARQARARSVKHFIQFRMVSQDSEEIVKLETGCLKIRWNRSLTEVVASTRSKLELCLGTNHLLCHALLSNYTMFIFMMALDTSFRHGEIWREMCTGWQGTMWTIA